MAMKPSEVAAAVNTNSVHTNNTNTETQWVAYSSQFTPALTRLMGSYMSDADLKNFSELDLILFPSQACQEDIDNRSYVRVKILPHVFNAAPGVLEVFLTQAALLDTPIPRMLLTKAGFDEGYFSATLQKFICFRPWRGVSALTAAAYSGDIFFVIRLLSYLIQDDKYRLEALQQLEEVQSRITEKTMREFTILLEAVNAITAMEFGKDDIVKEEARLRLEKIKKEAEFQRLISDLSIVEEARRAGFTPSIDKQKLEQSESRIPNIGPGQNAKVEGKINAENISTQHAEDAEFLTPLLALLKAYINYLVQHPDVTSADHNWIEKNNLWEIIGECQKRLFHNIKQEYFDRNKIFSANSPVDFNRAPNRGPCKYTDGEELNLDRLGIGTNNGFYNSLDDGGGCGLAFRWDTEESVSIVTENLGAIVPLFELRSTGLRNLIEVLKKHDVREADLVAACQNNAQAAKKP